MMLDRRGFLGLGALLLSRWSLRSRGDKPLPRLVLLQLTGGNDGLSTVIPWADDDYHRARKTLAIPPDRVLKLDSYRGLHPSLQGLRRSFDDGQLAIIEGVGYEEPVRSHFRSLDVWHTGHRAGRRTGEGWVSRLCSEAFGDLEVPELVVHLGQRVPYSLHSVDRPAVSFATPSTYRWASPPRSQAEYAKHSADRDGATDSARTRLLSKLRGVMQDAHQSSDRIRRAVIGYEPKANYPEGVFGDHLRTIAALIASGSPTRVFSLELDGFDTHVDQLRRYGRLMVELDRGLLAFRKDLAARELSGGVVVLAFSEFGRRVKENAGNGTDHGTAGPMFVLGDRVRGGLYGKHPDLAKLDDGDLRFTTDFRSVYASMIESCFATPNQAVLGRRFDPLPLFG